jgi:hypothetical protein
MTPTVPIVKPLNLRCQRIKTHKMWHGKEGALRKRLLISAQRLFTPALQAYRIPPIVLP